VGGAVFVIWMYLSGNSLLGLNAGVLGLPVSTLLFVAVSLVTKPTVAAFTEGFVGGTAVPAGPAVPAA
jgi:SSS family solute:Na+ symporter